MVRAPSSCITGPILIRGLMTKVSMALLNLTSLTMTTVLTWVTLYWFSKSGPGASIRIYYEYEKSGSREAIVSKPSKAPIGVSLFPQDIFYSTKLYVCRTSGSPLSPDVHSEYFLVAGGRQFQTSSSTKSTSLEVILQRSRNRKSSQTT